MSNSHYSLVEDVPGESHSEEEKESVQHDSDFVENSPPRAVSVDENELMDFPSETDPHALSTWMRNLKFDASQFQVVWGVPSTEILASAGNGLRIALADDTVSFAVPELFPELWTMVHEMEGVASLTCEHVETKVCLSTEAKIITQQCMFTQMQEMAKLLLYMLQDGFRFFQAQRGKRSTAQYLSDYPLKYNQMSFRYRSTVGRDEMMKEFTSVNDQLVMTELLRDDVGDWDKKNLMAIVCAMAVDAKTITSRRKIDVTRMMANERSVFDIITNILVDIVVDVLCFTMKSIWMACQPIVSLETFVSISIPGLPVCSYPSECSPAEETRRR